VAIVIFIVAFMIWNGSVSAMQVILIPLLLSVGAIMTAGFALLFSSLSVYLRDVLQILSTALQAVFYMSPILYPLSAVPEKLRFFIRLNPVTSLAESLHSVILFDRLPEVIDMGYLLAVTVIATVSGYYVFRKLKKGFADVL
jgi:lipopolysaccharide transport system permease protein